MLEIYTLLSLGYSMATLMATVWEQLTRYLFEDNSGTLSLTVDDILKRISYLTVLQDTIGGIRSDSFTQTFLHVKVIGPRMTLNLCSVVHKLLNR